MAEMTDEMIATLLKNINSRIRAKIADRTYWSDIHFINTYVPCTPYTIPTSAQKRISAIKIASYFCGAGGSTHPAILEDIAIVLFSMSAPGQHETLFKHILSRDVNARQITGSTWESEKDIRVLNSKWPTMMKSLDAISAEEVQDAINILGVYCLMCFRLLATPFESVSTSMNNDHVNIFRDMYGYRTPHMFSIKSKVLSTLSTFLKKRHGKALELFAIIVMRYLVEVSMPSPNQQKIKGILMSSCLLQLKLNGMGALKLFEQVKTQYNMKTSDLLRILPDIWCGDFLYQVAEHYKQIKNIEYIINACHWGIIRSHVQHSWPWARIFNHTQYIRFSASRSLRMSAHLAAILYQNPSQKGIEKKSFLQKPGARMLFEGALEFGATFHRNFEPSKNNTSQ